MMTTMQKNKFVLGVKIVCLSIILTGCYPDNTPPVRDQEAQQNLTPDQVLENLITGNKRFLANAALHRNDLQMKGATASKLGQFPKAVILACMDSRSIPEIVFDQSVGDLFVLRVAGNIVTKPMIGSIEYGTKYAGAKLIVVMGHTRCGAVEAACKGIRDGNLASIIDVITPAVKEVESQLPKDCSNNAFVTKIAEQNVRNMKQLILKESPVIAALVANKEVAIVGALHNLASGKVEFFDSTQTTN